MRLTISERRCPKCGSPLYLIPDSETTTWGVHEVDLICENCLHVERVTTIVAEKED
jgi:RNase P subunit RPR2